MTDDTEWVALDNVANIVHLATLNGNQPDDPVDSWTPIDLTSLPDQPPVQPTLGGTNLIYPGKRHVFSGAPESAKTLAAYTILIMVARHGQTAILIDFEMGAYDARQRLYELGATRDEVQAIYFLEPDESASETRIAALVDLQAALVVVDAAAGAYALQGLDDNKRQDVEKLTRLYVSTFWRAGIATIFIDHVVKDSESRGRFAIGSERKLGGADVHFGFETIQAISRGTAGRYKILTHKDRAGYMKRGHVADMILESDPDTHAISWSFTEPQTTDSEGYFRPTHLMEKVSIDLENRMEPTTRNNVYSAVGGTKEYVLKAIDALVREQFVSESSGPNRSKLLATARAYREDDVDCNPISEPGGSVVRQWFGSGSANHTESGSVVGTSLAPYRGQVNHPNHTRQDHQDPGQWFGELTAEHDAYIDSLEPDLEDGE